MNILGLDIGTNSIGWALINSQDHKILGMGSRIIPMGAELSKFEQGQAQTKNANRRLARGLRKLNKRYKQRRNKLIYILQQLQMLPEYIKLAEPFSDPRKIDRICLLPIEKNQKQYTALDLLELRVRALHERVSLKDLGRIIYLFNQLRGYSGGGNEAEKEEENEEAETPEKEKRNDSYIVFAKVLSISEPELITFKGRQLKKFSVNIETEDNELTGETLLELLKPGESLELLVNIRKSKLGETITFRLPNKTNWRKKMENLENELVEISREQGKEVYLSEYFLGILRENRWAKIRNNVILRSRYQSEFDAIWKEQAKYHDVLQNSEANALASILQFIFPGTKETQNQFRQTGMKGGLYHVVRNQVIYYQRELKDQTHLISDCRYEQGEKAIAKSHPVFQEFKIWEQINKLTINSKKEAGRNKKGETKYEYSDRPIPAKLKEWIYDELQEKKEIGIGTIINKLKKEYAIIEGTDFLNGMNPKAKIRGNDTRLQLKKALGEILWNQLRLDSLGNQIKLWDILYNGRGNEYDITSDRTARILAFIKENTNGIQDAEILAVKISKIKFSRDYSALSLIAIEKILPLVRAGKYFNSALSDELKVKIVRLLNETVEDPFEKSVQEFLDKNQAEVLVQGGIMNAYATILVFNKHTAQEYGTEEQIKKYTEIKRLKPGELRNPLVEQLISETLIIVRDIWKQYKIKPDQIRLELARELKNNAERRAKIYSNNRDNQKANEEVKGLLTELNQEISLANIEKYKLWLTQENLQDAYLKQYKDPSRSEIEKMRLWKEQGHVSPYTGKPIPLSELFNRERYDVDHIIPQSRYFDDSFGNKVICEKNVNKEKGNKTAMEYFETGSLIPSVLSKKDYLDHVNHYFTGIKRSNLLSTKVPEDPVARQLKETQYISLRVKEEMNRIVGNNNVKVTTGGVTDYLRNHWGLTEIFKKILLDRYKKVLPILAEAEYEKNKAAFDKEKREYAKNNIPFNKIDIDKDRFISSFEENTIHKKNNKLIIPGWSKRIDHRHHALDALVIACTEPKHIKRLNDLNKELQNWLDKKRVDLLPEFKGTPSELLEEILNLESEKREEIFRQIENFRTIPIPWTGFPEAADAALKEVIVSQKPKDKLLVQENHEGRFQVKIRGQLHEGTLYSKSQGVEAYRIPLSKLAGRNFATEKTIEKIANSFLKEFIGNHLKDFDNKKEDAFSVEGILILNKKLEERTNKAGSQKPHKPINSIKIFYRDPSKIKKKKTDDEPEDALQRLDRPKAYNQSLYVKTGGNYLFAILEKEGKRAFDLITFFDAANLIKEEFNKCRDKRSFDKEAVFKQYFEFKNKAKLLWTLKQGDPVYLPAIGEDIITDISSPLFASYWSDKAARSKNIQYVTQFSKKQIYFIGHTIADPIVRGKEYGSQNAYEHIDEISIKKYCIKLNIDRLGNILPHKNEGNGRQFRNQSILSEPLTAYHSKAVTAVTSYEQMEADQLKYWASLTPEARLLEHKKMAEKQLGQENKSGNNKDRIINFDLE